MSTTSLVRNSDDRSHDSATRTDERFSPIGLKVSILACSSSRSGNLFACRCFDIEFNFLQVLVVDDDPMCLKVVSAMLQRCNYTGMLLSFCTICSSYSE